MFVRRALFFFFVAVWLWYPGAFFAAPVPFSLCGVVHGWVWKGRGDEWHQLEHTYDSKEPAEGPGRVARGAWDQVAVSGALIEPVSHSLRSLVRLRICTHVIGGEKIDEQSFVVQKSPI